MEALSIEVPESPPTATACQWCGEPAVAMAEVEPADINSRTKELRKRAKTAPVCAKHRDLVERSIRRQHLERERDRLRTRLRTRLAPESKPAAKARERLKRVEHELAALA